MQAESRSLCDDMYRCNGYQPEREGGRIYFIRMLAWWAWMRKTWLTRTRGVGAEIGLMGLAGVRGVPDLLARILTTSTFAPKGHRNRFSRGVRCLGRSFVGSRSWVDAGPGPGPGRGRGRWVVVLLTLVSSSGHFLSPMDLANVSGGGM